MPEVTYQQKQTPNIQYPTSNVQLRDNDMSQHRFSIERWTLNVERWTLPNMCELELTQPLTFEPILMERIWGGRRLEIEFAKKLPPQKRIGESWEIVDRPEAQSVVAHGPLKGKTLHELWIDNREAVFGETLKTAGEARALTRFPLLIKLLDAREKLSLQVHPPERAAKKLGAEPKTEFWYITAADTGAELLLGFRQRLTPGQFETALRNGTAADYIEKIPVRPGDAAFLPAGRLHAISGGNLLIEIQQNSDTTYRVFDWNRADHRGERRQLHIAQALECIDFDDVRPQLVQPQGELLFRNHLFEIQKWDLKTPREAVPLGQFAIVCCLSGSITCAGLNLAPGDFCLIPAALTRRELQPQRKATSVLRIIIPR